MPEANNNDGPDTKQNVKQDAEQDAEQYAEQYAEQDTEAHPKSDAKPDIFGKDNMKIYIGIFLAFAIGLVGFYVFSAEYGDGLEVTMEEAGIEEGEAAYTSPLDYGDNYGMTLAMGIVGFFATLLAGYLIARGLRKKDAAERR